jgi:hypothetical protein
MKQLAVIVVLPIITLISCVSLLELLEVQQGTNRLMPVTETVKETIEVPSTGKGWHTVHMKTFKRFTHRIPFRKTDICFECHKKTEYKIFDPHDQLNDKGDVVAEKCLYCHIKKPDTKHETFKEVKLIMDPEMLCLRCHSSHFHLKHPVNADHIRKPSAKMLEMMKTTEVLYGLILPLDYNGNITCVTCHNPHERGVIPAEKIGSKGASEKFRIRLPEPAESPELKRASEKVEFRMPSNRICLACHLDK